MHYIEFSEVKALNETFDLWQLKVLEHGGNEKFKNYIWEYEKEREKTFPLLYRTDAAQYYIKQLHFKIKGVTFTERAPPKNDYEVGLYAAQDTGKALN